MKKYTLILSFLFLCSTCFADSINVETSSGTVVGKPISVPCPCCNYSTVVVYNDGPTIETEENGVLKIITPTKKICEGCGYSWYGSNSELISNKKIVEAK